MLVMISCESDVYTNDVNDNWQVYVKVMLHKS